MISFSITFAVSWSLIVAIPRILQRFELSVIQQVSYFRETYCKGLSDLCVINYSEVQDSRACYFIVLSVSFIFATLTIALNTRLLLPNRLEGIGWFTFETFKRVCANHPEHDFLFIFDRPFDESFITSANIKGVVVAPQARHPILYRIWFGWSIPRVLKKHNVDLFISPDGYLSLNTEVPQIAVMHDLNFEHHPEDLPAVHGNFYRKYFPKYARKATRIATVSEYSKQDIHACYGVNPDKIDVVYNGVGDIFSPADEQTKSSTQEEVAGGKPYFVL